MNFDLRLPIGIMFSLFGAMLVLFGLATGGADMYRDHSLGVNINLSWGLVLLVFGAFMLVLARKGLHHPLANPPPPASGASADPAQPPR